VSDLYFYSKNSSFNLLVIPRILKGLGYLEVLDFFSLAYVLLAWIKSDLNSLQLNSFKLYFCYHHFHYLICYCYLLGPTENLFRVCPSKQEANEYWSYYFEESFSCPCIVEFICPRAFWICIFL